MRRPLDIAIRIKSNQGAYILFLAPAVFPQRIAARIDADVGVVLSTALLDKASHLLELSRFEPFRTHAAVHFRGNRQNTVRDILIQRMKKLQRIHFASPPPFDYPES